MDSNKIQSYIKTIKEIKNAENTTGSALFNSLQAEEYANALSSVDAKQAALLLSTQGVATAQIQQTLAAKGLTTEEQYQAMAEAGLLTNKQKLSNVELQSVLTSQLGSEAKAEETMASMGLSTAIEGEEAQTVQLTAKKLQQAITDGILTKEEAELLAMTTGVTIAQEVQAVSVMPKWIATIRSMALATWEEVEATVAWLATNPAGWLTLLAAGALVAIKAYETLSISIEEQKEKMENSLSAYEDARSKLSSITTELENQKQAMDDLLAKDKLTYTEEGQLDELQAITQELRIQKDLTEREENREAKQLAEDASDLFNKLFGDYDISESAVDKYQNDLNMGVTNIAELTFDLNDIPALIAAYKHTNELLDDAYENGRQDDIDYFKSSLEDLNDSIFSTAQDLQEQQNNISNYYNTIKDTPYKDLTTEQKEIADSYNSISNAIALIYKQLEPNTWNSMQIDNLFDTNGIEKTKEELIEMAKEGTLDESTIKSYSKLNSALEESNIILAEGQSAASLLCDEMYALAEQEAKNSTITKELFSSFSDTDFGTRIQHITDLFNEGTLTHKEYFDALQSEIDNFDASNFTDSIEDMNKASEQFFVDSVQQTASGLSDLINSFDNGEMSISEYLEGYLAIGNTLSTLTDSLQDNSAAWNENSEAISDAENTALDNTQTKLNNAMATIESYQDSIYSLEQIMTDAVEVGSDDFTAHAQVIAQDLYDIVQNGGEMADEIASTLGTTTSEIAQSLTENVSNQELACQAIAANTNNAIADMANSIGELFDTLGNAISDFKVDLTFGVSDFSLKDVVLGVLGVQKLPEINFSLQASGESLESIGNAISSFGKSVASNYIPQTIDLEDFHFGNTDAASDRNYTPSSDITKNYEDALDNIKDSTSSTKDEFEELFDFFERRITVMDDALSLLESNLENVTGSFAKNQLIDAEVNLNAEKINNYTDALAMYTEKANEALSKLPSDIAQKIKDGAVDLTDFIGDSNEAVVDAINDYEEWAEKIADCQQELAELKETIRQLELEKFNNIIEDFTNAFDLRDDANSLIDKQIALLEEAGEIIGESFYTAQIDQSKKQLSILEGEKAKLVEQMTSALSSGRIEKGTDEWLEMVSALADVDESILDCKTSIEEFDNAILDLHTEIFDRIQEQFSNLNSELENLGGLFDDFDVSDDKGNWTNEGLAQLGLLAQQYELAEYQVQQYNAEIDQLNADYLARRYSATEYADRLAELTSAQWDAVNASESVKSAIMELNEARIDAEIEGINKEIDAYKELIDAQINLIDETEALIEKRDTLAGKTKTVTDLERQIAAMMNDDSAPTVAKRKLLEEQLAEAKKDLADTEREYSVETQKDALNEQYENFEAEKNAEIEALEASLEDREIIIAQSFESVKANADIVGQEIATIATQHGVTVSNALISSWQSGEMAIASYGTVLSDGTSAFIGNIMGVENEVWNLQAQANSAADSLAWMFATRADNLVNELTASYYSEANLASMTNALQQSLVNTLERGYNVSGITSALDSITNAANAAANAINSIGNGSANTTSSNRLVYNSVDSSTGETLYKDSVTGMIETVSYWRKYGAKLGISSTELSKLPKYASGTRNAEEGLLIKDEEGYELVLPKLANGNYTITGEGDQILTKAQTDNLFDWSKFNPDDLIPVNVPGFSSMLPSLPDVESRNVGSPTLTIDKLVQVNGNVDDTNIGRIENVAKKSINDAFVRFRKQLIYGGN